MSRRSRPIGRPKTDVVFGILASEAEGYRRWWWANYADGGKQAALRAEWAPYLTPFSEFEIRDGLKRWRAGDADLSHPPTPAEFAAFMRPVHSEASRKGLAGLRSALGV
ncbi:hypothetical protein ACQE3E_06580 [Methylomonas sp. MED-D]|uniref:hypothetical protein n=1 Tax=Methylomonas sp. MED-D TaxID=3418768 RepID=UPI003D00D4CB